MGVAGFDARELQRRTPSPTRRGSANRGTWSALNAPSGPASHPRRSCGRRRPATEADRAQGVTTPDLDWAICAITATTWSVTSTTPPKWPATKTRASPQQT